MGSGRKKEVKAPEIKAPPQITRMDFNSPTGDLYSTLRSGKTETTTSKLSHLTQGTVDTSMNALRDLSQELYRPDATRANDIIDRSRDFYDLQAQSINAQADEIFSRASSDLSKRFGGTYNATFGTDYLSRLENNRLSNLSSAAKEARLLGEDLYLQDEESRMRRFNVFHGYLTDKYNEAAGLSNRAAATLTETHSRCHPEVEFLDISTKLPVQSKITFLKLVVKESEETAVGNLFESRRRKPETFEWVFYRLPWPFKIAA